ncbi:MAG TPA: hypothetical protein VHZ07_02440 [Bryobacteraceae bacterium]|jgi:hypothetical protein|nr:hypothetical protein [Bryobacteraceae bacterium]
MIDLKLNELPVDAEGDFENNPKYTEAQKAEIRRRRERAGLSIKDTIAGDELMSVGARGVDTSGVESGAGAGAGTSELTPGAPGESPMPDVETAAKREDL